MATARLFMDSNGSWAIPVDGTTQEFIIDGLSRDNRVHGWRFVFYDTDPSATPTPALGTPTGGDILVEAASLIVPSPYFEAVPGGSVQAENTYVSTRPVPASALQVAATKVTLQAVTGVSFAVIQYEGQ